MVHNTIGHAECAPAPTGGCTDINRSFTLYYRGVRQCRS